MAKIKLNVSSWKIKTQERSRNRMKFTVKLSKDEAEGFKNWSGLVKPDNISDDEFIKQIFFNGIEHLNDKLRKISEEVLSNPEMIKNLEASGVNVSALEDSLKNNQ